jgi:hypothetical protein
MFDAIRYCFAVLVDSGCSMCLLFLGWCMVSRTQVYVVSFRVKVSLSFCPGPPNHGSAHIPPCYLAGRLLVSHCHLPPGVWPTPSDISKNWLLHVTESASFTWKRAQGDAPCLEPCCTCIERANQLIAPQNNHFIFQAVPRYGFLRRDFRELIVLGLYRVRLAAPGMHGPDQPAAAWLTRLWRKRDGAA